MKHIILLIVFAMFITGCAGNEKQNTNENTKLKFDDPWMQRLWDKSKEVTEAYREVDRAKKNVVRLEDKIRLLEDDKSPENHDLLYFMKQDLDQARKNVASTEAEADKRRKEFDQLANEHKEELLRKTRR